MNTHYARINEAVKKLQERINELEELKTHSCMTCHDKYCILVGIETDCCPSYSDKPNHRMTQQ